jgi:hypothetical protein
VAYYVSPVLGVKHSMGKVPVQTPERQLGSTGINFMTTSVDEIFELIYTESSFTASVCNLFYKTRDNLLF